MFDATPQEEALENSNYVKLIVAPKSLQDGSNAVMEPLDTVDLGTDPTIQK